LVIILICSSNIGKFLTTPSWYKYR